MATTITFASLKTSIYSPVYASDGFEVGGADGMGIIAPGNVSYISANGVGVVLGDRWSIQSTAGGTWSSTGITLSISPVASPALTSVTWAVTVYGPNASVISTGTLTVALTAGTVATASVPGSPFSDVVEITFEGDAQACQIGEIAIA